MVGTTNGRAPGSSPLSRGIHTRGSSGRYRTRIIPALAGNTQSLVCVSSDTWDHPRSRGEYAVAKSASHSLRGSSPLSRGILVQVLPYVNTVRIIPALAGNTHSFWQCSWRIWDHPRSRGEYFMVAHFSRNFLGSSPLSRGIPRSDIEQLSAYGIIPALAGNTAYRTNCPTRQSDHPRSRGEYPRPRRRTSLVLGSSPLSRGIPNICTYQTGRLRIIPALAGNTRIFLVSGHERWDHPRSRGEYLLVGMLRSARLGSSPLSRGILDCIGRIYSVTRIIPALAGNTRRCPSACGRRRDHPRSRGEYHSGGRRSQTGNGSSPLSRGIQHPWKHQAPADRIIPALAGNTLAAALYLLITKDHPRSRGEYTC